MRYSFISSHAPFPLPLLSNISFHYAPVISIIAPKLACSITVVASVITFIIKLFSNFLFSSLNSVIRPCSYLQILCPCCTPSLPRYPISLIRSNKNLYTFYSKWHIGCHIYFHCQSLSYFLVTYFLFSIFHMTDPTFLASAIPLAD